MNVIVTTLNTTKTAKRSLRRIYRSKEFKAADSSLELGMIYLSIDIFNDISFVCLCL